MSEVPMSRPGIDHVAVVSFGLGTVPTAVEIDRAVEAAAERLRYHIRRYYANRVVAP